MKSTALLFTLVFFLNAGKLSVAIRQNPICSLPKVVGPCKARIPRYFYNSGTGRCELFFYGGCRGNENNFKMVDECKNACMYRILCVNRNLICCLPKKVGLCRARIPRYFYNKHTKKCEFFYYGGCRGNKNNFKSLSKCKNACYHRFVKG